MSSAQQVRTSYRLSLCLVAILMLMLMGSYSILFLPPERTAFDVREAVNQRPQ
jgi:hypothetical protein